MLTPLFRGVKAGAQNSPLQQFTTIDKVAAKFAGVGGTVVTIWVDLDEVDLDEMDQYDFGERTEAVEIAKDEYLGLTYRMYQIPSQVLLDNAERWQKTEQSVQEFVEGVGPFSAEVRKK